MGKFVALFLVLAILFMTVSLGLTTATAPGESNWRSGVTHPNGVCGTYVEPSPNSEVVGSYATHAQRCLVSSTGVWVELEDGTYIPAAWMHPYPCLVNWLWFPVPDKVSGKSSAFHIIDP